MTRFIVGLFSVVLMVSGSGLVNGQDYPNKPIRVVMGTAGGSADFAARLIAQGLTSNLGQPVIVDNRGGSLVIPAEIVAKASPDGYTLTFSSNSLWILPFMQDVPYDAVKDFLPITLAVTQANIVIVHPSLAVKTVKELIALAKSKPGGLNYASGPSGFATHLAGELFKSMAGVNIVRIPYTGGGPAVNALLAGEVHMMIPTAASVTPHLQSGRLKALAVTSAKPSALFPSLPTVAASGLPGYESEAIYGVFAPGKTPGTLVNRLNREIVRFLDRTEVKERFLSAGVEVVGSSPEQFAAARKSDMARMGKVIKDAGIRAE